MRKFIFFCKLQMYIGHFLHTFFDVNIGLFWQSWGAGGSWKDVMLQEIRVDWAIWVGRARYSLRLLTTEVYKHTILKLHCHKHTYGKCSNLTTSRVAPIGVRFLKICYPLFATYYKFYMDSQHSRHLPPLVHFNIFAPTNFCFQIFLKKSIFV